MSQEEDHNFREALAAYRNWLLSQKGEDFGLFYQLTFQQLLKRTRRYWAIPDDLNSACNDAYLALWHKKPDLQNAMGLLTVVARRKLIRFMISHKRRAEREQDYISGISQITAEEDLASVFDNWLELLSPSQRQLVELKFVDEKTWDEIGKILGLHPDTVRSRWEKIRPKAVNSLKKALTL